MHIWQAHSQTPPGTLQTIFVPALSHTAPKESRGKCVLAPIGNPFGSQNGSTVRVSATKPHTGHTRTRDRPHQVGKGRFWQRSPTTEPPKSQTWAQKGSRPVVKGGIFGWFWAHLEPFVPLQMHGWCLARGRKCPKRGRNKQTCF